MTRLLLIRHALTDPGGRLCGSFDVPLSPAGRAQLAALVGRGPRRAAPDALFSSPSRRANDVAAALASAWGLPPQRADWGREIHCGAMEGLALTQIQREFPDLWARNDAQRDDTFAWPGGESYGEFRARVLAGLRAAADAYPGGSVAVVTHAGVISQVLGVIRGRPASVWAPDRPQALTGTEITWELGGPGEILTFNEPDWY